jgi:hypothetical protein
VLGLLVSLVALTFFAGLVWLAGSAVRLLAPEREVPFDASARREAARRRGVAVPVGARDIVEDLRRRPIRPAMPERAAVAEGDRPGGAPLVKDLWMRRN